MADTQQLIEAVQAGDAERVDTLLGVRPELAATRDADGISAVLHALYRGRRDIADRFLAAGHSPDLHEAVCLGMTERVEAFVRSSGDAVGEWSADGFTPLHLAAFFGHAGIAGLLLDAGADVHATARNAMAVEPLHSATAGRHGEVVALLLARGADPNRGQAGGYTPLMSAAGAGDAALIGMLLKSGADPSIAAADGRTAESLARERDHAEIVPLLKGDG